MSSETPILEVYQTGPTTVVGFGGREILDQVNLVVFRDELVTLIEQEKCHTLAFDLTGVQLVPSGLLGLLSSIRDHNVKVQVFNPSPDVREVLSITRLDTLFEVRDVDVSP